MTLRLVIEHSPHPQRVAEQLLEAGDLSIGRGAECDWQLEDPDVYISRKHCVISGRDGHFTVTDASRGGLFVDGHTTPLGAGVAATLEHGTRLRLGDVVIRVEVLGAAPHAMDLPARAAPQPRGFDTDDFFAARPAAAPAPPRPESLPQPFDGSPAPFSPAPPARVVVAPLFDDPFTLDPVATPAAVPAPTPSGLADFGFSFDDPAPVHQPVPHVVAPASSLADSATDWPAAVPPAPVSAQGPEAPVTSPAAVADETTLIDAFFKGLGIDPDILPQHGSPAEFEALGRRFRLLTDGLVTLLRARARDKNSVRVAQTVIGASDVNPLKFVATTEDALGALAAPRGRGYLDPEDAILAAFRDLSDHQLRTWTALQSSLRRMIDRFDPAAFEVEVEEVGLVKSLLSGSRSGRLWQLYTERYHNIAKSAEDRFLGDIGADFRNAYEGNKENGS